MDTLVTLTEAATYLGVSKATLRNWDRQRKLIAERHPLNRYRVYRMDDLRALNIQPSLFEDELSNTSPDQREKVQDSRSVKRVVSRLHAILRDTDAGSAIIQRFDELTKLLFLKLVSDKEGSTVFEGMANETAIQYADRLRLSYRERAERNLEVIPPEFSTLGCSDTAVYQCGVALAAVSFAGADFDLKGIVYEEVIRGTFDKSDHQQFFTPHQVVSFMTAMMQPFLTGTVADPACGTGGFLAEVARKKVAIDHLIGLEIDERLAWVSGVNLLLHDAASFEVSCLGNGGTLGPQSTPYIASFDAILTNPPFGSDFADAKALETFVLGTGRVSRRRGILFLERCWDLLKDEGVVAIVIDEGVLNLSSAIDVRRFILDRFDILAIVDLPETAFMPYASVNASILFLRKTKDTKRSQRVFFAKAEVIGRKPNGDDDIAYDQLGGSRPNSDLPAILLQWQAHNQDSQIAETDQWFVGDVDRNLGNDESLRLDFRYHHPSRSRTGELLERSQYSLWTLADLCDERNELIIPSSDMPGQIILYTGLAHMESKTGVAQQVPTPAASLKSAVKRYEPGDILFARMRPNLRKVALASFEEGGYVSPECSVLIIRKGPDSEVIIDPEVLAALLRSDLVYGQLMHLIAGIGRPRLSLKDLRRVLIPIRARSTQLAAKHSYIGRIAAAKDLRAKAQLLFQEAGDLETRAVVELADCMIGV